MCSFLNAVGQMSKDFKEGSGRIRFASLKAAVEACLEGARHVSGPHGSQPCRGSSLQ